ncbi:MAG: dockerin type I repeat-containing protein [Candidatus Bipolaricaulia bacterium]
MKTSLIALLLLLLLLVAPAIGLGAPSGDDEADVVDITSDAGLEAPLGAQPGQNNVLVQAVKVDDPGDRGDRIPDNFDTAIETVTIKKVEGSTLEDRFVRKVRLYLDSGSERFEPGEDFLLGEVSNPNLTSGVTFGKSGSLLTRVEDEQVAIFFVVMDFADSAPDGATLRTSLDLTVGDSLIGGPTISSGLDPAAFPPVLRGAGSPAYFFLKITSTTGDLEADIIEETPAMTATPGDLVVLQQFTIADPGPTGDADSDGYPTLVRNITVKKFAGTADTSRILKLMLYREKAATPPGFQVEDELLGVINNPNLEAGVTFHNSGRRLLRVADKSEERLYIVAQLAPVGFADGDTLQIGVQVVAKDDPQKPGAEVSSGIETPMPVVAASPLTIEVPPPTIFIGACEPPQVGGPCEKVSSRVELKPLEQGTLYVAVKYVPEPGLGEFQLGPEGAIIYDPEVLEVTKVKGVGPYQVESYDLANPGLVYFIASLKPGRAGISEGPVVELTIRPVEGVEPGTETELTIADEAGIEMVDAFKDAAGKELVPDIVPGFVKIKLLKGDVDADSVVTASDARLVARYILGLEQLTSEQREAADVAPPFGVIDVTDVRYIAQAAAGLRVLEDPASAHQGSLLTIAQLADWRLITPSPRKLEVRGFTLSFSRSLGAYTLRVEGQNIAGGRLRIYSLAGARVFEREFLGNLLQFQLNGPGGAWPWLANGVYLYVLQVRGYSGEVWHSEIRKLVILR